MKSEGSEGWRQAWEQLDLAHSLTPATILRPRPELSLDTVKAVLAGDAQALSSAASGLRLWAAGARRGRGGQRRVRHAARRNRQRGRASISAGATRSRATPRLPRARPPRPPSASSRTAGRSTQTGEAPPTEVKYEEGTGSESAPSAEPEAPSKGEIPRNVVAQVEFSSLKDWQDIRGRLMNVAGIQALEVNSLSARGGLGHLRLCRLARPPPAGARPERL